MKQYFHLVLLTLFSNVIFAQEKHFVYIESENRQPFNVSVNGQLYSSTSSGYLIIPKLAAGDYTATIGFPGHTGTAQTFKYKIDQKDLGFDLRNLGEKGWGLFNQQTLTLITGAQTSADGIVKTNSNKPPEEEKGPEISFERKKDTATKPSEKIGEQVVVSETPSASTVKDSTASLAAITPSAETASSQPEPTQIASTEAPPVSAVTPEPGSPKKEIGPRRSRNAANSRVKKVSEVKGDMGVYLTYEDSDAEARDTVQLIIPVDADSKTEKKEPVTRPNSGSSTTRRSVKKNRPESGNPQPQFLDMQMSNTEKADTTTTAVVSPSDTPAPANDGTPVVNSACTNLASESDYSKLRKRMASQNTEEAKLKEARKVFKNKCFTTGQIKGLSTLFLSDAERYRFFDVSYNVVTDVQIYSSLEKELIDPYYINRFKAMLKK